MKATGVTRKIDDLGRVCLPISLRRGLDLNEGDPIEIFVDGENIMLRKYEPACTFCGKPGVMFYKGKHICEACSVCISDHVANVIDLYDIEPGQPEAECRDGMKAG